MSTLNDLTNERLISIKRQGLPGEKKCSRFLRIQKDILYDLGIAD